MSEWYGAAEGIRSTRSASPTDEELLWVRLFRTLDEIDSTIARLDRVAPDQNAAAVAALERLRGDILAALRLAVSDVARHA